ncbi:MAG: hypothetical protein WCP55_03030 [Lentisphaerota bacterium]
MVFENITQAKKLTKLSYIGMVNNSAKHEKAYKYNEMVYTIYLAPAASSGYEVCPGSTHECRQACLAQSGRNIMDEGRETINGSRIKKTKLFFEEREFLVRWIYEEIKAAKKKADRTGYRFSVRLNNTSDISPEDFWITDHYLSTGHPIEAIGAYKKNLLELFPDIQFYDYTKVPSRIELLKKYPNYDLTFSFNGYNEILCKSLLARHIRVAVVFNVVPEEFWGHEVINGNDYDMRYLDPETVIIGLPYKKVRNQLDINNKFVIQ